MADPNHVPQFQRLTDCITTSGQPNENELGDLYGIGVRHVVNLALHTHERALPDERASVEALGMRYTHIPVPFGAPTDAHFRAFCEAIETADAEPTHVHCIMNWRVSAFFYRYHREVLGMPEAFARAYLEEQWSPETSDYPDAPVWAAFILRQAQDERE